MLDLLVLSPHLDDAALSCGGTIAAKRRGGGSARVVTIFAGEESANFRSPVIDELVSHWKLEHGQVVAQRRVEDRSACRALDVEFEQWDFHEAIYRRNENTGQAIYSQLDELFVPGGSSVGEPELVNELAARLGDLPAARRVLAPLGVGGHVDHWLVNEAASKCFGMQLRFYEEFPYSRWKLLAVWRATRPRRNWTSEIEELTPDDVAIRCGAIGCYESLLAALFGGQEKMERLVRSTVRRAGGERFWNHRSIGDL